MKKFLALGSLVLALNAYSQSYMILNNGVTLTTDKAAFVYDVGHFILPYKVTISGGQFLVEDGKFVTIDEKGLLFRKNEEAPSKIKGKGANYLIASTGSLYTFDSKGYLYKFDKDSSFKKASSFGGNYFLVPEKKGVVNLYTINTKGNSFKLNIPGLNPATIKTFGGNYFQTSTGVVYTVTKDGFVFSKSSIKTGLIKKTGGNFFIDSNNALYTVSETGYLLLPSLPAKLKIANITKLGQNYFVDKDGKFYGVDHLGAVYERVTKGHNLKDAKIISF